LNNNQCIGECMVPSLLYGHLKPLAKLLVNSDTCIPKHWVMTRAVTLTLLPPHTPVMTSQIPHDCLVMVTRLLQSLMLPMVISSLPNLLTVWYSALHCASNHSDINANVFENQIKHFKRTHELMLHNISIGLAIAREKVF
jgi:hypothetical protein